MAAGDKSSLKVALIDFASNGSKLFWQQRFFNLTLKWQLIGAVNEYQVIYYAIPWQEKVFTKFSLEKQRQLLLRILRNAHKQGCVVCGIPMRWRMILAGNSLLEIPSAKELVLDKIIADLAALLHGLANKNIAVFGVDGRFSKILTDKLLAKDANLILNGTKASSLSDWYYRNSGLAIPVFRTEKAGEAADGIIALGGEVLRKYEAKTVRYGDVLVKMKGNWQQPFAEGKFSCGLAAALLAVGAESEAGFEKTAEQKLQKTAV